MNESKWKAWLENYVDVKMAEALGAVKKSCLKEWLIFFGNHCRKQERSGRIREVNTGEKKQKLDSLIMDVIVQLVLLEKSHQRLLAKKRMQPDSRLAVVLAAKQDLCNNILFGRLELAPSWVEEKKLQCKEAEQFEEVLEKFINRMFPEESAVVTENLEKEMEQILSKQKTGQALKKGGLIL